MIVFLVIAASMVVAALAWIVVPLLRRARTAGVDHEDANLSILRDQLRELDSDLASGIITQEQYEHARRELEQRVLEDTTVRAPATGGTPAFAGAWTAAIAASTLPIAAALLYALLGNHQAFFPAASTAPPTTAGQHDLTPEKINQMIAKLEARLEKEPNNAEGWVVLAHSYFRLNRIPEAIRAYDRAVTLVPDDAGLLADYADAVAANQKTIEGKPLELVARALAIDPTQWKALALAGTAAFDRKDFKQAIAYWEKLKATLPPDSNVARSLDASIAEARAAAGGQSVAPEAKATAGGAKNADTESRPAPPPQVAAAAGGGSVAGTITLSTALSAGAAPTDTVFVFARAAQGPRMPLAILRKQVKDLPVTFSLDDSMAMSPELKISNFPEVIVGARVSKSGSATPQSGDLEGFSQPVKLGASSVAVIIDRARP